MNIPILSVLTLAVLALSWLILIPIDQSVVVDTRFSFSLQQSLISTKSTERLFRTKQTVRFTSGSETVVGLLTLPMNRNDQDSPPPPVIIMAHGLGSLFQFGLQSYVAIFARNGFATLVFNYRHFGESEGLPRHLIDPVKQVQDYQAAIEYVQSTKGLHGTVNAHHVLLWGTSFSGGHVLEVMSKRLFLHEPMCVVSQIPHLSGKVASGRGMVKRGVSGTFRLVFAAIQDYGRKLLRTSPVMIKIASEDDVMALMPMSKSEHELYQSKLPRHIPGNWQNLTPARSLFSLLFYSPLASLWEVSKELQELSKSKKQLPGVFFIGADNDELCPSDLIREASRLIPGSLVHMEHNQTHFGIYRNCKSLAREMLAFYTECMIHHS